MTSKLKHKLTIDIIGKKRFWLGIGIGIVSSIILTLGFKYLVLSLRIFEVSLNEPNNLPQHEIAFYDFSYAIIASTLAFCICTFIWFAKNNTHKRKSHFWILRTNVMFFFWFTLLALLKMVEYIMPFNGNDYQYAFSFYEEFGYILFLIPVFLFLLNWMYISRIYKAFRWMLISFITIICLSFVVNSFTKLDTSLPNRIYQKKFESELTHIEKELNRIKTEYHLEFDHKTIQQLKNIKSNEHKELAYQIKEVMLKKEANVKDIFLAKMYVDLNQIYFEPRFSEHQKAYGYSILKPSETWGLMSTYDQNSQEYNELLLLMESLFLNSISERVNDTNDHYEMIRRKESFKAISQIHFYELKDSIPFTGTTLEQLKTLPEPSF